jgi:hypothetical protein
MPNPQYIWTLSNATVATISSSGLLLARTLGTTFVFFFFFSFFSFLLIVSILWICILQMEVV